MGLQRAYFGFKLELLLCVMLDLRLEAGFCLILNLLVKYQHYEREKIRHLRVAEIQQLLKVFPFTLESR